MYITSPARLRFDITYYTKKLRNEQNRRMHNNSWLTTLPLWCELHQLPHSTCSGIRCTFKPRIHLHDDYLIFPHHMPFTQMLSNQYIYPLQNLNILLILPLLDFYRNFITTTMETADYWPMAWEYSIWNATIASLQFWTEDLNLDTLGIATEHIYTTFFWTSTSHTLCQQSEETLFGCFVIALNATFTQQLSLADEGYESGSDTIDLPTPLQKTPCIHHVSSMEHTSFNSVSTTPHSTVTITPCGMPQNPPRPVHRCLSFSSDNDQAPDSTPVYSNSSNNEEDFQMVPLDDEHWTPEEMPERTFCIHEQGLPHILCQYPCPYGSNNIPSYMGSLDLSDILDYEDYMVTSSDEGIWGMEEVLYWHWTLVCLNNLLPFWL